MTVGFALLVGAATFAQTSPPSSGAASPGQPTGPQVGPTADSYVVSLSTGELINTANDQEAGNASSGQTPVVLSEYADGLRVRDPKRFRHQFFYGVSVASAYTSDDAGLRTSSHAFTTISPYMALLTPTKTGSLILQYDALINPHDTSVLEPGAQAFQAFSLTARGALTRRWSWTLVGSSGDGSEAARLEGPLTFSVAQNIPVLDASSTVVLPTTNVFFFAATGQLAFQKNERDSFGFTLGQTYTGIDGVPNDPNAPAQHSSFLAVREDFQHLVSARLTLSGYADEETVLSGPGCYSFGGGAGLSAQLTRGVSLEVEGGPQLTSPGCGGQQRANFGAVLADRLDRKDRIYVRASRVFAPQYQTQATWQDNLAAGFSKDMGRSTFTTDAGFVRQTVTGAPPYHGFFAAPRFHVKLVTGLGLTAGYRAFRVTGRGLPGGVLNYAAVSLDWYPAGLRFK